MNRNGALLAVLIFISATGTGLCATGSGLCATGSGLSTTGSGLHTTGSSLSTTGSGLSTTGSGLYNGLDSHVLDTAPPTEKKRVGVMWVGQAMMPQRVLNGIKTGLSMKEAAVELEVRKALPDMEAAMVVYERWNREKDAIVFLRSSGARFMAQNPPDVIGFIGAANHPVQLGAVKNMDEPEGRITGVTYFLDPLVHLNLFQQVFPGLRSVGLLVEKGHPGSPIEQEMTRNACQTLGIDYHEAVIVHKDDIARHVRALAEHADILIIGNEALVIDNAGLIVEAAGDTPVVSYAERPVTSGHALLGLVPEDEKLGRMLADSIIDIVVHGKHVSQVPVKMDDNPRILLSVEKISHWNVAVPLHILRRAVPVQPHPVPDD